MKALLKTLHFKYFPLFSFIFNKRFKSLSRIAQKQRFLTENPRLPLLNVRWWEDHIIAFDFLGLSATSINISETLSRKISDLCVLVFYNIVFLTDAGLGAV